MPTSYSKGSESIQLFRTSVKMRWTTSKKSINDLKSIHWPHEAAKAMFIAAPAAA
ncbi:MAG TPA: hypothetical protein VJ822_07045 [Dongiaceae bacterium]|nr:hypothetical protein [Dongiaceae bacterium]